MPRFRRIVLVTLVTLAALFGCANVAHAAPKAEAWAWCGPHSADPMRLTYLANLKAAGIDAVFGACNPIPAGYSPAFPGSRYMAPSEYFALTYDAATRGLKTIVYDARIWSTDPTVRSQAIEYWRPFWTSGLIRAWDLGDEFDPADSVEWPLLVSRWRTVIDHVLPVTGVGPFTNHLPWALDEALRDLPFAGSHLAFDDYNISTATATAQQFGPQVNHLMCAVNALKHGSFNPTQNLVRDHIVWLRYVGGCDSFLMFGGVSPLREGVTGFGPNSIVRMDNGAVFPIGTGMKIGLSA